MMIGQTVMAPSESAATYYGPWVPRQGDKVSTAIEFLRKSGALASFSYSLETKNEEDPDTSASAIIAGVSIDNASPGNVTGEATDGCKELVRFKFTVEGSGALRWVHFRALPLSWARN